MSISLYDTSVQVMQRGLRYAAKFLQTGQDHLDATKTPHTVLLQARLIEDMLPLVGQVQRFCDTAKNTAVRVAGVPNVVMPDNEKTFEDVQGRIAATLKFLEGVSPDAFAGREEAEVIFPAPGGNRTYTGTRYVLEFALPNFFFHVTTAYDLLRARGVPVGKRHYLGWE
jgi:uncharacterized protein